MVMSKLHISSLPLMLANRSAILAIRLEKYTKGTSLISSPQSVDTVKAPISGTSWSPMIALDNFCWLCSLVIDTFKVWNHLSCYDYDYLVYIGLMYYLLNTLACSMEFPSQPSLPKLVV